MKSENSIEKAEVCEADFNLNNVVDSEIIEEPETVKTEAIQKPEMADASFSGESESWSVLTAERLFQLAMSVSFIDQARWMFGYNYEVELRRECQTLIPTPPRNFFDFWHICLCWYYSPNFFRCQSIGIVLAERMKNAN